MNRQNLKDLIELIAALGVIVTLAFVAFEIRQNTNVARSATIQAIAEQSYDAVMRLVDNNQLRTAYTAASDGGELNNEQKRQLQMFYAALMRIQLHRHEQIKLGIIDLDLALNLGGHGEGYSSASFVEFWNEVKGRYPADFQAYMEQHVISKN